MAWQAAKPSARQRGLDVVEVTGRCLSWRRNHAARSRCRFGRRHRPPCPKSDWQFHRPVVQPSLKAEQPADCAAGFGCNRRTAGGRSDDLMKASWLADQPCVHAAILTLAYRLVSSVDKKKDATPGADLTDKEMLFSLSVTMLRTGTPSPGICNAPIELPCRLLVAPGGKAEVGRPSRFGRS